MTCPGCHGSGYVDSPHGARYAHPCPSCYVDRRRLVVDHMHMVTSAAAYFSTKIPRADRDDLIGYGMIGLCEAGQRFEPWRGLAFSTLAFVRIRGAIIDGVRTMCWGGRKTRPTMVYDVADDLIATETDVDALLSVYEGMGKLTDSDRELVHAAWIRGERVIDLAKERGITKGWASRLLTRAEGALARELA